LAGAAGGPGGGAALAVELVTERALL
jgi:hypothetical protein